MRNKYVKNILDYMPEEVKDKVEEYARDLMYSKNNRCCYCRRKFSESNPKTKDHFIPISRSGTGGDNILECCDECNQWKADKMPDFWLNRVIYFERKRTLYGNYTLVDYRQIIGSIRHWMKFFKGKKISDYR